MYIFVKKSLIFNETIKMNLNCSDTLSEVTLFNYIYGNYKLLWKFTKIILNML